MTALILNYEIVEGQKEEFAHSFEKISRKCVLKLTPSRIHFVLKDPGEGTQVWCTVPAPSVFEDYLVESFYQNEIWLEIKIEYLLRAFKSMISGHLVKMKLSKDGQTPILAISIHSESNETPFIIQQAVPVQPLQRIQIQEIREPRIPAQEVYILLPLIHQLKNLADRFKALSPHATLSANHQGVLIFSIDTPNVAIETKFQNLRNPAPYVNNVSALLPQVDPTEFFKVTFDINDFLKFLHCHHANPSHIICGVHHGICLVFYVYIQDPMEHHKDEPDVELRYYIPGKIV